MTSSIVLQIKPICKVFNMLNFLKNLDEDIKKALVAQLRNLWTHESTGVNNGCWLTGGFATLNPPYALQIFREPEIVGWIKERKRRIHQKIL